MSSGRDKELEYSLLLLRWATAAFLAVWAVDKIFGPARAIQTFSKYYLPISGDTLIMSFGVLQLLVVLAFAAGAFRTFSYGAVLAMHAVSVFASYPRYLEPLARPNILFWAGVPVLAGIILLFVLRHRDRLFSYDATRT